MTVQANDITIRAGNTRRLLFTIRDEQGELFPLLGSSLTFWFARSNKVKAENVEVKKTEADGITITGDGQCQVFLESDDTDVTPGQYYFELQIQDIENNISTVSYGNIIIERSLIK